jgi:signal transduction histidine kinase
MSSESGEPAAADNAAPSPSRRRTSVAFRLGAWYAISLLVGLGLLGGLAIFTIRHAVARSEDVVIRERLERQREVLERVGLPRFAEAVNAAEALGGEHAPMRVRNGGGETLFRHGNVDAGGAIVSTSVRGNLVLEVASTADPWRHIRGTVTLGVALVLLGCLALGIAGGAQLTRRTLRPVAALASTARTVIQSGDLSRRVEVGQSGSELDELARLVNRMLDRNQDLVRSMREALDNVAHDLRTPLTRLRGIAEVALQGQDPDQAGEALGDCIEECDRVLQMLRSLMDISEAEAGIMRLDRASVDLRALAAETVDLYEQVAEDAGVSLRLEPGDQVRASVDRSRIRQALANLVDNAVKYTPRGGQVVIDVGQDPPAREAWLRVRDSGYGIPADSIARIWDRLYRIDPSRATRGLGLGLSLVKAIAIAHGGRVSVESERDRGSTFMFTVPINGLALPDTQD